MMDKLPTPNQKTGTRRLREQTVGLFKWTKRQVRNSPLQCILVIGLWLTLGWLTWRAYKSSNMGFDNKTFWDWMQLLIVPVILAIGAWWLRKSERETEQGIAERNREEDRAIANDRRHQTTLEAYLDRMTDLLLENGLRESEESDEVRSIARARTLAVLWSLDKERRGQVVQFLHESRLIALDPIIELANANLLSVDLSWANLAEANLSDAYLSAASLAGADLRGADLRHTHLEGAGLSAASLAGANLSRANLLRADLSRADLTGANLSRAYLDGAYLDRCDLSSANLNGAYLSGAGLGGAKVTTEQLAQAASLQGATLPDGTKLSEENWQAEFEEWREKQEE